MRTYDINGEMIVPPSGYYEARKSILDLLDSMESAKVDRADMRCVLSSLMTEAEFHLRFRYEKRTA